MGNLIQKKTELLDCDGDALAALTIQTEEPLTKLYTARHASQGDSLSDQNGQKISAYSLTITSP